MLRIHSPHVVSDATAFRSQIAPPKRVNIARTLLIAPRPNAAMWRACMALKVESLSLTTIATAIAADASVATLFRSVCHRIEPRTIGQQSIDRLLILLGRRRCLYLLSGLIAAELCARLQSSPAHDAEPVHSSPAAPSMNSDTQSRLAGLVDIIHAATAAERAVAAASARPHHSGPHLGQAFANSLFTELGELLRQQSIISDSTRVVRRTSDSQASSNPDRLLAIWMQTWNIPQELHPYRRQIRRPKPVREPLCTS